MSAPTVRPLRNGEGVDEEGHVPVYSDIDEVQLELALLESEERREGVHGSPRFKAVKHQ